jgi:hypothetical protein
LNSSLNAQLDSKSVVNEVSLLIGSVVLLLISGYLRIDSCLQEEKRALAAFCNNLDRLYRDDSNSLTILEMSHRFTMADLDHHRHELQVSQDEILRLR